MIYFITWYKNKLLIKFVGARGGASSISTSNLSSEHFKYQFLTSFRWMLESRGLKYWLRRSGKGSTIWSGWKRPLPIKCTYKNRSLSYTFVLSIKIWFLILVAALIDCFSDPETLSLEHDAKRFCRVSVQRFVVNKKSRKNLSQKRDFGKSAFTLAISSHPYERNDSS